MCAASVTVLPRRIPPTILVVDDDAVLRCSVSDALRSHGFRVVEARSADEALTVLDTLRVDLLLADTRLPGARTGLDVARAIRERSLPTKIILTSGEEDSSAAGPESLGSFVPKPYRLPDIVGLIARSLNWPDGPEGAPGN
jgi:CheY-like chemotaxis protein